jgi:hypothetical protein
MRSLFVVPTVLVVWLCLEQATVAGAAESPSGKARINWAFGLCGTATSSKIAAIKPPDTSTDDNPPAAFVELSKACNGVVVGNFSANVNTPFEGTFISIDMRATCLATGGFPKPCSVGEQFLAKHAQTILQANYAPNPRENSITMIWPRLSPGIWRFEVLPGGDGKASLFNRNFTATALEQE